MKHFLSFLFAAVLFLLPVSFAQATTGTPLDNGSFEDLETTLWECDLNCTIPVNAYFVFSATGAYDDSYYAYLFHDAGIYQTVTVPTDAETLSFWYDNQPDSLAEEEGSFVVALLDPATNEPYTQQSYDAVTDVWTNATLTVPSELRGQPVVVYMYNLTGYNRIDYIEWYAAAQEEENDEPEEEYAQLKVRVLNMKENPVKHAQVFVKKNGERLPILKLSNNENYQSLKTNNKGYAPKFMLTQTISDDDVLKLCVKKKKTTNCSSLTVEGGTLTRLVFTFKKK